MRLLNRSTEPVDLSKVRIAQLNVLRALGREPKSKEISGYALAGEELWKIQHKKCCYCEAKLLLKYNDVEHYRPKTTADRLPGCRSTHGYWWLAFTWSNLMFSCSGCNRSAKRVRFPLANGTSGSLAEDLTFLGEKPLLINPYEINPTEHITFIRESYKGTSLSRWYARPRNASILGNYTIDVCDLNRAELLEMRQDHWDNALSPPISDLSDALRSSDIALAKAHFVGIIRLFSPAMIFSAFSYDAITQTIPGSDINRVLGVTWPLLKP